MRSARWSGWRRSRSTRSARPDDDPRLRAAEQLVAAEADEIGACGERRARGRLVRQIEQRAGAEVVEQRQRARARDAGEIFERRLLGEADDAEVRLMDAEQQRRSLVDRALVVGGARPVRRPDLDEPRARACEHVGDAEPVADLDQLAARDDHVAPFGERSEREQQGARVVVHDERGFGAGEPAQDRGDVILARAAPSFGEVVLEIRVAAGRLDRALERGGGERRAAEVRVDDHPRRVEHPAERGPARLPELLAQERRQVARLARRAGSSRVPARSRPARRRRRADRRSSRASSSTDGRSRSSMPGTIRPPLSLLHCPW